MDEMRVVIFDHERAYVLRLESYDKHYGTHHPSHIEIALKGTIESRHPLLGSNAGVVGELVQLLIEGKVPVPSVRALVAEALLYNQKDGT